MTTLTEMWPALAVLTLIFGAALYIAHRSESLEAARERGIADGRDDMRRLR